MSYYEQEISVFFDCELHWSVEYHDGVVIINTIVNALGIS
jgi:hypothetical protein